MNVEEASTSECNEGTLVNTSLGQKTRVSSTDKQTSDARENRECDVTGPDELMTRRHSSESSISYEAFWGEFCAEEIDPVDEILGDDNDHDIEATSLFGDEQILIEESSLFDETEMMSQTIKPQTRVETNVVGRKVPKLKKYLRPHSARDVSRSHSSLEGIRDSNLSENEEKQERIQANAQRLSGIRRYSSTGDLRNAGKNNSSLKRRILPDLSTCVRIGSDSDLTLAPDVTSELVPSTPGDRKMLEAQFKLLYRENIKLDKAYGDLQEKVRSESPQILSGRFLSPREAEWKNERKNLKNEIERLKEKVSKLKDPFEVGNISQSPSISLSPSSERTELHFKEEIHRLQQVKDEEISRLSEQVSYWMRQSDFDNPRDQGNLDAKNRISQLEEELKISNNKMARRKLVLEERIAELEHSEANLKCQLINLEDKLTQVKTDLASTRCQNDDLSEHCGNLENCLAVLDAEKLLLDELKKENGEMRRKLSEVENDEKILVGKLAKLAEENAEMERKLNSANQSTNQQYLDKEGQIKNMNSENNRLKIELNSLKDRCVGLEDVKECLIDQIKNMEEDAESSKYLNQIKKLNANIRALKDDKTKLNESKEHLELEQELHSDMGDKLNKRISDLQDHIETLKSQLESQKSKLLSFDQVQEQLESISEDKCALETLCNKYENEVETVKNQLNDHQVRLSESFERANAQLMEETDEMVTRQRNLLAENQKLRMRTSSCGIDAAIGQKLRENIREFLLTCEEISCEVLSQISRQSHQLKECLSDGDLPIESLPVDTDLSIAQTSLTDVEVDEIINVFAEKIMGTTLEEIQQLQCQSPRLNHEPSLAQLRERVQENHVMSIALQRIKLAVASMRNFTENNENIDEVSLEIRTLRKQIHAQSYDQVKEGLEGEKHELVNEELQVLKVENKLLVETSKRALGEYRTGEEKLKLKLEESQTTCQELVNRMRILQEEKFSMIETQQRERMRDATNVKTVVEETNHKLQVAQKENLALLSEVNNWKEKLMTSETDYQCLIDSMTSDLKESRQSESELRNNLDETQRAGEDLMKRVESMQGELREMHDTHGDEITTISHAIETKNELLKKSLEEVSSMRKERGLLEEKASILTTENVHLSTNLKDIERRFMEQDAHLLEIENKCRMNEDENTELKVKLDQVQQEKEQQDSTYKEEITELKLKLAQKVKLIKELEESLDQEIKNAQVLQTEWKRSTESYSQLETTSSKVEKEHESAIEILSKSNKQMEQELNSLRQEIQLQRSENDKTTKMQEQITNNQALFDHNAQLLRQLEERDALNGDIKRQWDDDNLVKQVMSKCEIIQNELKVKEKENENLMTEQKSLERKLRQAVKEIEDLNERLQKYESKVVSDDSTIVTSSNKIDANSTKQRKEDEEEIDSLKHDYNELVENNLRLSEEISSYQETLNKSRSQIIELEVQLTTEKRNKNHEKVSTAIQTDFVCFDESKYSLSNTRSFERKIENSENNKASFKQDDCAVLSEVDYLRTKCLKLERNLAEAKLLIVDSAAAVTFESASSITTMESVAHVKSGDEEFGLHDNMSCQSNKGTAGGRDSADTTSVISVESIGNVSTTESNQISSSTKWKSEDIKQMSRENNLLKSKISELETMLAAKSPHECVSRLRIENERLLGLLRQVQSESCSSQTELQEIRSTVTCLQRKLNDVEGRNQQSGTESEPEGIHYERKDGTKDLEKLNLQLQETECLVVAHKNKLDHVENMNEELRLSIAKLKEENKKLKSALKLPNHPLVDDLCVDIQNSLSRTSHVLTEDSTTPRGSWTEGETLPFDKIVEMLCNKVVETRDAIALEQATSEKLSRILSETREKMNSLEGMHEKLQQETCDVSDRLRLKTAELNQENARSRNLEDLLSMNESRNKESLRSKEEDIEKLQEKLLSLTNDLETRSGELQEVVDARNDEAAQYKEKSDVMCKKLSTLTEEIERKSEETDELKRKTSLVESRESECQEEMKEMKQKFDDLQRENKEALQRARESLSGGQNLADQLNSTVNTHEATIEKLRIQINDLEENRINLSEVMSTREESIANLNLTLSEKGEEIDSLSARVGELLITEEALKTTMDSADEIIAEREKEHLVEVENLKDGLNRTLSEARRAEMSNEELHKELSDLEIINNNLKIEMESLRHEENDAVTQIETMEMERALMNTSLDNAREESGELIERNEFLMQENKEINESIDELQMTIEQLNLQVTELRCENDKSSLVVHDKEEEISAMKSENLRLITKLEKISREKDEFLVLKQVDDHESNKRLEYELQDAQDRLKVAHKLVDGLRVDKKAFEDEIQRIRDDHQRQSIMKPQQTESSDKRDDRDDSEMSRHEVHDEHFHEMILEQMTTARLQEESVSLRSENEALRSKIASLEGSITEMTERLVPKLELGSIADESEPIKIRDDDTGRYLKECDVDTARADPASKEILEEKLKDSEEAAAQLLMQVQEMEEEAEMLRNNIQGLSNKNDVLQKEFFGTISEGFQAQIDELTIANSSLGDALKQKDLQLIEQHEQIMRASAIESQWTHRYEGLQKVAEELRQQLHRTELDNHELQGRLIDLDQECRILNDRANAGQVTTSDVMKRSMSDAFAQTLSINELFNEIKAVLKARKARKFSENGLQQDTEDEVSDLDSSSASIVSRDHAFAIQSNSLMSNLAEDRLLQQTIMNDRNEAKKDEEFNSDEIPDPVTEPNEQISQATEPRSTTTNNTVKSLQNELLGYQLMIEKLKRRNQELLEGSGAIMTQDEKESLEREVSALRGQVALLERNNRIFSHRERTELKQDLDLSNKRCGSFQAQLQAIKSSLEYEEVENLKKQLEDVLKDSENLSLKLREYENAESEADDESSQSNDVGEKFARLVILEDEAEDLRNKMNEKNEVLKDRDVMIEELQHQLENIKWKHSEEANKLKTKNQENETSMKEEIKELEREISESKEIINLKQTNLENKSDQLDECGSEIEKLEKDSQKKNIEIDRLQWDIEALQKENISLRQRIEQLKIALTSSTHLVDVISPIVSSSNTSLHASSKSSIRHPSFHEGSDVKIGDVTRLSNDAIATNYITAFDDHSYGYHERKVTSFDEEDGNIKSSLRNGIKDAQETVHQIGNVLNTPRLSPVRKSPVHEREMATVSVDGELPLPIPKLEEECQSISSNSKYEIETKVTKHPNAADSLKIDLTSSSSPSSSSSSSECNESSTESDVKLQMSLMKLQPSDEIGNVEKVFELEIVNNSNGNKEMSKVEDGVEDKSKRSITSHHSSTKEDDNDSIRHNREGEDSDTSCTKAEIASDDEFVNNDSASKSNLSPPVVEGIHQPSNVVMGDSGKPPVVEGIQQPSNVVGESGKPPVVERIHQPSNVVGESGKPPVVEGIHQPSNVVGGSGKPPVVEGIHQPSNAVGGSGKPPVVEGIQQPSNVVGESGKPPVVEGIQQPSNVVGESGKPPVVEGIQQPSNVVGESGKPPVVEGIQQPNNVVMGDSGKPPVVEGIQQPSNVVMGDSGKPPVWSPGHVVSEKKDEPTNIPISPANFPLLPDDRPTLIQEVTKARDEARKWFAEVTQSDRDKRLLRRRLEALESELVRLKDVEDNYDLMRMNHEETKRVSRDLELVRAQAELANKKAEEVRERNALLRVHLLDKEEVENENKQLKKNVESMLRREIDDNTNVKALPLSEVQETVPMLKSSSPHKRESPSQHQLKDVKDSFEYIATNFAQLVLKKHDAELSLAPQQAKVSKLKRKCLERDQLLAKLVLKIRKKKKSDGVSHDTSSASSTCLEDVLLQADDLIRADVLEENQSDADEIKSNKPHQIKSFLSPPRPPANLMRSMSDRSAQPTHRIYIAKHDYAPSSQQSSDISITHSLLPDLSLLSGDTVVAIGNADQREDGKMYQMAEIRGKIGFVPLSHLVAAERVEGMQAFMLERGKTGRKRSSTSPEKIVNLYKKLEQAHLIVADKMKRNSKPRSCDVSSDNLRSHKKWNSLSMFPDHDLEYVSSASIEQTRGRRQHASSSLHGDTSFDNSDVIIDNKYDAAAGSAINDFNENVRTSTPVSSHPYVPYRRSSSLPPRRASSRSSKSEISTPGQFISSPHPRHQHHHSPHKERSSSSSRGKDKSHRSDDSFRSISSRGSPIMTSPQPPTFLVIEKTMGQKSMIICWTPPLLDMISRSNNIPVIGYEISIDKQRKVQISGAYTNKAILGDLNLTKSSTIEVRTVSSVGTLSSPCEVIFTPNPYSPSHLDIEKSKASERKEDNQISRVKTRSATALYDYDPNVDSPYKTYHDEIALEQGDEVIIMGTPRADGFCDVQAGSRRGYAPIAFLISDCDVSMDTSEPLSKHNDTRTRKQRRKARTKERSSRRSASSDSSFQK